MANVKINIPGIGEVTAENAASEETLMRLVEAIEKQTTALSKNSGGDSKASKNPKEIKETKDLIDAKKKETKAVDDTTKSTKSANKGTEEYTRAQKKSTEALNLLKNAWDGMKPGLGQAGGALIDFGASVGKTAVSVATAFAKSYDEMAKNPIGAAQGLLNTGIDLAASAAKTAADVLTGGAKSIGGLLGPFSGAVTGAADAFNAAAKAAIDLAVTLAKTANDVFAKEFQKSVDALKSYTAQGASFAGGMTEMRTVANGASLSLKTLADSAKMASSDFRTMGLSQGEGVKKLAKGMEAAAKTVGKSGGSLRDEMLALGYSYEEQGGVMASYMAQQKASGALEKMTTEQIARGTKDYAVNLKVLSDMTGKDAKKLMEKANLESQRGAIASKLSAEQQSSFKDTYAALSGFGDELGPKVQAGLMQLLAGGTITDPMLNTNKELMALLTKAAQQIKAGNTNMLVETQKSMGQAAENQRKYGEKVTSEIGIMAPAIGGVVKEMGTAQDALGSYRYDPKAGQQMKDAATAQSEATDDTTKGYQRITKAANDAAVVMEKMVGANLGVYANTLAASYVTAQELFVKGITAMQQMLDGTLFGDGGKTAVAKADTKLTTATKAEDKAYKDATVLQKIGIGTTDEQKKASLERNNAANQQYQAQISNVDAAVAAAEQAAKDRRAEGKANGEFMAKLRSFFHGEGFAKGGIATGPKTGYPAMLHGTEAVIPLEGGKKVPIDVSSISTAATMASASDGISGQMAKMASMISPSRPLMPNTTNLSSNAKNLDAEITNTLGEQFNKLSSLFVKDKEETKQQKQTPTNASNNDQLLKEIKELMSSQLAKHDEMIEKLGETVDINQRLLTNSYS